MIPNRPRANLRIQRQLSNTHGSWWQVQLPDKGDLGTNGIDHRNFAESRWLFLMRMCSKCNWEVRDVFLLSPFFRTCWSPCWRESSGFPSLCIHTSAVVLRYVNMFYCQCLSPHWEQELLVSRNPDPLILYPEKEGSTRHRQGPPSLLIAWPKAFLSLLFIHTSRFRSIRATFNERDNNQDLKNAHLWSLESA